MSRFTTRIPAYGPGGNIYDILGNARVLMRQLNLPRDEIEALCTRVSQSASYEEAVDIVREYFPVDTDGRNA